MEEERKPAGRGRPKGRGRIDPTVPKTEDTGEESKEAKEDDPVKLEASVLETGLAGDVSAGLGELAVTSPAPGGVRGREAYVQQPYLRTRPSVPTFSKSGIAGSAIQLVANYFKMEKRANFGVYQYRVDFEPEYDDARIRRAILHKYNEKEPLPIYAFDGTVLYCREELKEEKLRLETKDQRTEEKIVITLKLVKVLEPEDGGMIQFHNVILRSIMHGMGLTLLGRHYYDHTMRIDKANWKLELWPGFMTALRTCDGGERMESLLNVEVTHKVIRTDTILNMMSEVKNQCRDAPESEKRKRMEEAVAGKIVMTKYNRTTYKILSIEWDKTPKSTFRKKNEDVSFMEYYKNKYHIEIGAAGQPLLLTEPKKQDVHRGDDRPVLIVPELCYATGLDEDMRANFHLTRDLSEHLHMVPGRRVDNVRNMIKRMMTTEKVKADLSNWGVRFVPDPVKVQGRILPTESLIFKDRNGTATEWPANAEWSKAFRDVQMFSVVDLKKWVLVVPVRSADGIDNLIRTLQKVSTPLNFRIAPPEIIRINNPNPDGYRKAIDDAMTSKNGDVQLFYVILPTNRLELYSSIKQRVSIDFGIPSQCFLAKNVNNKGLMSICTKVAIQMNAKLGGEPWAVKNPLPKVMVIGFDVYHGGGHSIGCMVATVKPNLARFYSTVDRFDGKREINEKMATPLSKCLEAFKASNNAYPDRIMFYRDGVGEGQLEDVYNIELEQIKNLLAVKYKELSPPKLTFIVVSKRINTRFFAQRGSNFDNPPPGTCVDTVVTLPERYDFYIVAQSVRQGTVSPCSYNVLHDTSNLSPDKIQIMTYKMCHLYYNWSGTVAVPAPCQYAHKLAYLTGLSLKRPVNKKLDFLLHFL